MGCDLQRSKCCLVFYLLKTFHLRREIEISDIIRPHNSDTASHLMSLLVVWLVKFHNFIHFYDESCICDANLQRVPDRAVVPNLGSVLPTGGCQTLQGVCNALSALRLSKLDFHFTTTPQEAMSGLLHSWSGPGQNVTFVARS